LGAEKVSHPAEDLALHNFLEGSLKQKGLVPKMPSVLLSKPVEFAVVAEETLIYNRSKIGAEQGEIVVVMARG